jgi:hypothetical protein
MAPYNIPFIEIGNEDDYSGGCDTYTSRLTLIHNTIHTAYPNITLVANNIDPSCLPSPPIPGLMYDYHYYRNPDDLAAMFDLWDNWARERGKVIVGEYGVRNFSDPNGVFWGFVQGSCAEAVHMIGLERNADVVRMAAYAPLVQHFGFTQWSVCFSFFFPLSFLLDSREARAKRWLERVLTMGAADTNRLRLAPKLLHPLNIILRTEDVLNESRDLCAPRTVISRAQSCVLGGNE